MKLFELENEKLPSKNTLNVNELAKKHGVSSQKIRYEIKKGTQVEFEHTNDKKIAREIAMDHIAEVLDYYDRLERHVEN
jgi:transcriptional antiterminator